MQVLDHEPQFWFLFEEDGALFLDANCSHSFFGYNFMIQLSPGEVLEYQEQGRPYLSWLARDIQDSAPILQGSHSIYKGRDVSSAYTEEVSQAVEAWRAAKDQEK